LRAVLVRELSDIEGLTILASEAGANSRYLSIIVEGFSAEEVLRSLLRQDISVDAGSACSPEDLTPSHVIAAMGFPTTGHLRLTIHPGHTEEDIKELSRSINDVLKALRR
jgi:cysteine desulfurase